MFKFIKNYNDLFDTTVDVEVIQRAKRRFDGAMTAVFGWVVQSTEEGKILWVVAGAMKAEDNNDKIQYGLVCMHLSKPMVQINMRNFDYYLPEFRGSIINWDMTSANIRFSGTSVLNTVYAKISLVSRIQALIVKGKSKEAKMFAPELITITQEMVNSESYFKAIDNAELVSVDCILPENARNKVTSYIEDSDMTEVVCSVICSELPVVA